jgi:hypothetical protein
MRLKMICFCSPVLHYDQENEQYRRGKVAWQDSSDDEWRLSALQAIRERFDEKLWRGKGEPKFDKQQKSPKYSTLTPKKGSDSRLTPKKVAARLVR